MSLVHTLKSIFGASRQGEKRQPRIFLDSASFDPKASRSAGDVAVIVAYNDARRIADRVRMALANHFAVIVIDQGSSDNTPYYAAEAGAAVILQEPNMTYAQAIREAANLAHRSVSKLRFLE